MIRTYPFHVLVGSVDYPAETTISAPDADTLNTAIAMFLPGGSMHNAECPILRVYPAGTVVPVEVAEHVEA